jgi:chlorophyllide a reductase subunit Z
MVFPLGSHLADVPKLADADVNICMYREYGRAAVRGARAALPAGADRAAQHHALPARARASCSDLDPEPFIEREKHTTIKPMWDLWRIGDPGLLRHRQLRQSWPTRPTPAASATSSRTRWACPAHFAVAAQAGREDRQRDGAPRWCTSKTPLVLFGSYNERMYLAERGGRAADVHPGLVPGRHHPPRTPARPSWATPAPPTWCRKFCNALFDALFHILPLGTDLDRIEATPHARADASSMPWDADAQAAARRAASTPSRCWCSISAAKRLRDRAEAARRARAGASA